MNGNSGDVDDLGDTLLFKAKEKIKLLAQRTAVAAAAARERENETGLKTHFRFLGELDHFDENLKGNFAVDRKLIAEQKGGSKEESRTEVMTELLKRGRNCSEVFWGRVD